MVGGVVSLTVIVCVAVAVFPEASVAVQVTRCVPTEKGPVSLGVTATDPVHIIRGCSRTKINIGEPASGLYGLAGWNRNYGGSSVLDGDLIINRTQRL